MADLAFLGLLKQKLTTGNRRSIHLNALPGRRLNRCDLFSLSLLNDAIPKEFIKTLLSEAKFSFPISGTAVPSSDLKLLKDQEFQKQRTFLNKRMDAMTFANNDNFLEHGTQPFGFGYPILLKRDSKDPSKIIKAPILIWHLDIIKSSSHAFKWTIKRGEDYPVSFNQVLLSHIEQDEQISIQNLSEEILQDQIIDETEIVDICNQLLKQLSTDEEHQHAVITPSPGADTIKFVDVIKPTIRWAGVFGLYKTQKEPIINDINNLIDLQKAKFTSSETEIHEPSSFIDLELPSSLQEVEEPYQNTTFCGVRTDPSQQAIINSIISSPNKIIQGPPGTGKSQSLTAIITNALENGAKCLVVCEKRTALEVIKENLDDLGLADLSIIIEDSSKDRRKVVNSVRDRIDQKFNIKNFPLVEYNALIRKAETSKNILKNGHEFLSVVRLGKDNWTSMVGKFLASEDIQSKDRIDPYLNTEEFDFEFAEYQGILQAIESSEFLFSKIKTKEKFESHPLDLINHKLYLEEQSGNLQFLLKKEIPILIKQIKSILLEFVNFIENFKIELKNFYENKSNDLSGEYFSLHELIEGNNSKYGKSFNQPFGLQKKITFILSSLSSKHKKIKQAQTDTLEKYKTLKEIHHQLNFFLFNFPEFDLESKTKLNDLLLNIKEYPKQLEVWKDGIPNLVIDWANKVGPKNTPDIIDIEQGLNELNLNYRNTIQKVNQSNLLNIHIIENSSSLKGQINGLSLLLTNLESIQIELINLADFQNWKRNFINLKEIEQNTLFALIKSNSPDWKGSFNSWYFNWLLARNESTHTPTSDQVVASLSSELSEIRKMQASKIKNKWSLEQINATARFNKKGENINVKRLFNKKSSKGNSRHSLRKILHTDIDLFISFFPVILVNPIVCSSIIPLKPGLFDVVIFDEASQLRLEDTFTALLRGKHKIVAGDIHQMPPSNYFGGASPLLTDPEIEDNFKLNDPENDSINLRNEIDLAEKESLLEYAEDLGYQRSFLDFHYRSRHPHLIEFSNAAFYGSRLIPMPALKDYQALHFLQVDGEYNLSRNEKEAEQVINLLLNTIKPINNSEKLPSVGIGTFNLYQRNLILEKIQNLKISDEEAAQKLFALEAQGLFVKNLENIQGDERDIIILSTTFGLKEDGKFRQSFGPINQAKGYKLLNVIITRAKYKLYVCTSIPENYFQNYHLEISEKGITGKNCLYAYLAYVQSIQNKDEDLRQNILALLEDNCLDIVDIKQSKIQKSAFIDVIEKEIKNNFKGHTIKAYYNYGGFNLDLAILPNKDQKNQTIFTIECDGNKNHSSSEAYVHDQYRSELFPRLGIKLKRIYSVNWWLNFESEKAQLFESINSWIKAE